MSRVTVGGGPPTRGRAADGMTPFAPLVDLLSAEHERADRRLFLS